MTTVTTGNSKIQISYKNGQASAVTIDGKKYTNVKVKDGTTIVRDENGKIVYKMKPNNNGGTDHITYSKGKKKQSVSTDKNGKPVSVSEYNKKGKIKKKTFCDTENTRTYEYKNGKLASSTDTDKNGVKLSTQTYSDKNQQDYYANKSGSLWSSRTFYDENGNVTSYKEYDYKKGKDGQVIKITTTYDSDGENKKKLSTQKDTQDSYGNVLIRKTTDASGNSQTTTYTYDEAEPKSKLDKTNLTQTVTETDTTTTTKNYENGQVKSKSVQTTVDGKSSTTSYEYEYHPNGKIKTLVKTNPNGDVVTTQYDENGNKINKTTTNTDGTNKYVDYLPDGTVSISQNEDGTVSEISYSPTGKEAIKLNQNNADIVSTLYALAGSEDITQEEKDAVNAMINEVLTAIANKTDSISSLANEINELIKNTQSESLKQTLSQLLLKVVSFDKENTADVNETDSSTPASEPEITITDEDSPVFPAFNALLENPNLTEEEKAKIQALKDLVISELQKSNKGPISIEVATQIIADLATLNAQKAENEKLDLTNISQLLLAAAASD